MTKRKPPALDWQGYHEAAVRAEWQDSGLDSDFLPYINAEAREICSHLERLIRSRRPPVEDVAKERELLFYWAKDAALVFEDARKLETFPILPELAWRPRLRRLKQTLDGLEGLLRSEPRYDELLAYGVALVSGSRSKWRRRVANDPKLLPSAIDCLLKDEFLGRAEGRPSDPALTAFVGAIAKVYEEATGTHATFTRNVESSRSEGPALRFIGVCVRPLCTGLTDEAIAMRLKRRRSAP